MFHGWRGITGQSYRASPGGVMDNVLPLPNPNWEDPEPTDAPEPEETDARAALTKLRNGLGPWLSLAAMTSLPPLQWRQMIALLNDTVATCVRADTDPVVTHVPAQIVVHPHPAVPKDGTCVRCALPVEHDVHPRELDANQ